MEAGVNPKTVATMLGHSDVTTTLQVYSHVTTDLLKEATNRLDERLGGQARASEAVR